MRSSTDKPLCTYHERAGGVYEFEFADSTRAAVQHWAYHLEKIQLERQWYGRGVVRLLINTRSATDLPIRYLLEILSDYNRPYPSLEPPRVKMAIVRSPETLVLDIYQMMAELFEPPLSMQFFIDEAKAVNWLEA